MKIIDKQGKLFGKLNIIDLIVIVLILAVVVFLAMRFLPGGGQALDGEGQDIVYTVKVENVEPGVYEFITDELEKGPSQLTASNEMLPAYVTKVEAMPVEATRVVLTDSGGYTQIKQDEKNNYDLVFTIEGSVKDNLSSELGTQEIRVGKAHIVKTTTFELANGIILSCDRLEPTEAAG